MRGTRQEVQDEMATTQMCIQNIHIVHCASFIYLLLFLNINSYDDKNIINDMQLASSTQKYIHTVTQSYTKLHIQSYTQLHIHSYTSKTLSNETT